MDPRHIQWQTFRPSKRYVQPSTPSENQTGLVRPVQQPSQWNSKQQQPRRKGCCGGGRTTE
jgi:hypothetical protein